MKTSKQDIQDLFSQLAADIEEIKTILNGNGGAVGTAVSADVVTDTGMFGKRNAISNDVAVGDGVTPANPDRIIAEINRRLEPIAEVCGKLPDRIKSYYAQLLLRIPQDLREELTRDNDTRKRNGLPTVEDKIDNTLIMAVAVYDRLNQLEDALLSSTPKSRIVAWIKSAWSRVRHLRAQRPNRWYRNPYILCAISICLLYFALSIYSWQQWHYYRTENTHLRLTADKYRVDSIILRELYPQATITLSAYEHFTETEGADAAINTFRENTNAVTE